MKKILFAILGLALAFTAVSCGTTEVKGTGIKSEAPTLATNKKVIVDYSGNALGRQIPEWVLLVSDGNHNAKAYESILPDMKNKKIFVTEAKGPNLDFLREWTDLVDIESQVSASLERVVGSAIKASSTGSAGSASTNVSTKTDAEMSKELETYRASLQNVRLTGLEKSNEYWIELMELDADGNPVDRYYTYYSIWAMDKNIYQEQLEAAMERVQETTTESEKLKAIIGQQLEATMNEATSITNED